MGIGILSGCQGHPGLLRLLRAHHHGALAGVCEKHPRACMWSPGLSLGVCGGECDPRA